MEDNVFIKEFALRLSFLRQQKNITARDMSISLGQSHNFINNIELCKNFPNMLNFFYICEFLEISPKDFFDYENKNSAKMAKTIENLSILSNKEFDNISLVIADLTTKGKG